MNKFLKSCMILGLSGCFFTVAFKDGKEPPKEIQLSLKMPKIEQEQANPQKNVIIPILQPTTELNPEPPEPKKFRPFQKIKERFKTVFHRQ